ncbi:MAG: DUF1153 domain-containing protein [Paracoccaceae bacterium]
MYLKKIDGPRSVSLPDGTVLTRADLPSPDTRRWVASRKLKVVQAVSYGLLPLNDALKRYDLSAEEFETWRDALALHGTEALKVTAIRGFRQL